MKRPLSGLLSLYLLFSCQQLLLPRSKRLSATFLPLHVLEYPSAIACSLDPKRLVSFPLSIGFVTTFPPNKVVNEKLRCSTVDNGR